MNRYEIVSMRNTEESFAQPGRYRILLVLAVLSFACGVVFGQTSDLGSTLRAIRNVAAVKPIDPPKGYAEAFELQLVQPLDHQNPSGPTFNQRVYLSHLDPSKPMVIVTEGYAALRNSLSEPTRLLKCNQVLVEHRFFGTSRPDSLQWRFLTVKQSAEDLHAVVTALRQIYHGKWVSTGVSKGGQTTCLYRYYFPDDVDVSIPYVAPINIAQEDPRPTEFLRHLGPDSVREKIRDFQVRALEKEELALPVLDTLAGSKKYTFSLGARLMYEFSVLEYPFAFWQYGGAEKASSIPGKDATPRDIVNHLQAIVNYWMYSDEGVRFYMPFQYQAYTEMGYYTYDITDFKPYLKSLYNPSNIILAPKGVEITYHPETFQAINRWLRYEGKNFIYVYGENDPWMASSIQLTGVTNSIKMVRKGGNHGSRIRDLSPAQQEVVYSALEQWLGTTIVREKPADAMK